MAKIYTKKGDKGQTGLPGERRASKTDQIFEVLGFLDQTSAQIGLAVSLMEQEKETNLGKMLQKVQSDLLTIGSALAAENGLNKENTTYLSDRVEEFEEQIDRWDEELPPLRNFILAGGTPAGAILHMVRTSVRQTERHFHRLPDNLKPAEIAQYLNRLSDYFFQTARYYNHQNHYPEPTWKPKG